MEKEFIIPKREVTSIDINEVNKLLEGHSYFELLTEAPQDSTKRKFYFLYRYSDVGCRLTT